jgi:hypothetical protein
MKNKKPTIYSTKKTFFAKFMHIFGIFMSLVLLGSVAFFMYCDVRSWLPSGKPTHCGGFSGSWERPDFIKLDR